MWKLRKALYGLRSSPKRWQEHFMKLVLKLGFAVHPQDPCVCVRKTKDCVVIVCYHVDDLLVVGPRADVEQVFKELGQNLNLTYGKVKEKATYLGRRLEMKLGEIVFGVDSKYVDGILEDNGLQDLKGSTELKWEKAKDDEEELGNLQQAQLRSLVGQLMWIDRSDTRKAIGKLATRLGHARETDQRNAIHVLRFLKGAPRVMTVKGIDFPNEVLKRATPGAARGQADADLGSDDDRKSTSGVIVWRNTSTKSGTWCSASRASRALWH